MDLRGIATFTQLVTQHGGIYPKTLTTITPRGGRHLIFLYDNNTEIGNSAGRIGPGVDVRGAGGYVLLPPSRNANGGLYYRDPNGSDQPAPAPDWLIELAKRKIQAWARAALDRECKAVASALPGTRNNTLNTAAFNLYQVVAGGGLEEDEVRDRLYEAAVACGLVQDDGVASVQATIASGAAGGRAKPRTRPQPRPRGGPRPIIQIIASQIPRMLNEMEDALLASGLPVFSRAGLLVEPAVETVLAANGRKTVAARLKPLSSDAFLKTIAEAVTFQKYDRRRNTWTDIDPPMQLIRTMLASAHCWKFPQVGGVITVPTLRSDGSLLCDPGYDPETELYLLPSFQLPLIPERPSKEQACVALGLLTDLLSEFSFADPIRLNRSVALSGILTAQVRGALPTAPILEAALLV